MLSAYILALSVASMASSERNERENMTNTRKNVVTDTSDIVIGMVGGRGLTSVLSPSNKGKSRVRIEVASQNIRS